MSPSPSLSGVPPALPESSAGTSALEEAFESGVGGSSPGSPGAGGGGKGPRILPGIPSTGGGTLEEDFGTTPEASELQYGEQASEPTEEEEASAGGAIVLGLLAGAFLFGLGLAARRGWMRWRYGL